MTIQEVKISSEKQEEGCKCGNCNCGKRDE